MASIPNTKRRGAIYWFSRSRRLPDGNQLRPTVSLRTACPKAARQRAALLSARFEEVYVRLVDDRKLRFALEPADAQRIFLKEFNKALDSLEQERELSTLADYEFGNIDYFLLLHKELYRFVSSATVHQKMNLEEWIEHAPHLHPSVAKEVFVQVQRYHALYYNHLDEIAELLQSENIETDMFYMDHAERLRNEARVAAIEEFERRMQDPGFRLKRYLQAQPLVDQAGASLGHRPMQTVVEAPVSRATPPTEASGFSNLEGITHAAGFAEQALACRNGLNQ